MNIGKLTPSQPSFRPPVGPPMLDRPSPPFHRLRRRIAAEPGRDEADAGRHRRGQPGCGHDAQGHRRQSVAAVRRQAAPDHPEQPGESRWHGVRAEWRLPKMPCAWGPTPSRWRSSSAATRKRHRCGWWVTRCGTRRAFELPVICHVYPRRFEGGPHVSYTPEDITWAVHCVTEVGVDVVKAPCCWAMWPRTPRSWRIAQHPSSPRAARRPTPWLRR